MTFLPERRKDNILRILYIKLHETVQKIKEGMVLRLLPQLRVCRINGKNAKKTLNVQRFPQSKAYLAGGEIIKRGHLVEQNHLDRNSLKAY